MAHRAFEGRHDAALEDKFEAAIEEPKPTTVTQLAEMGKQVRLYQPRLQASHTLDRCREALGRVLPFQ
jgi:hypothetical protein